MRTFKLGTRFAIVFAVALWVAVWSNSVASAQVTQAIQKLLPSTVGVEWKATNSTTVKLNSIQLPEGLEGALDLSSVLLLADAAAVDSVSYASGTILSADGFIVTTVGEKEGGELSVTLPDGRQLPAKLRVHDWRTGLKLIEVEAQELTPVAISSFEALLGEQVAAVLCTDLQERQAATGIVAARNRILPGFSVPLVQTDLPTETMSAGAPLAKLDGEVIGILIAKLGSETGASGPSFAIPAGYVTQLLNARSGEEVVEIKRGYLGVKLTDEGAPAVEEVFEGTPAFQAGIRVGDVLLKIDAANVANSKAVVNHIGRHRAGDEIAVTLQRDGLEQEARVQLGVAPDPEPAAMQQLSQVDTGNVYQVLLDPSASSTGLIELIPKTQTQHFTIGFADAPANVTPAAGATDSYAEAVGRLFATQQQAPSTTTLTVERSEVEKQLGELSEQVKALHQALEKMSGELQKLSERLDK